MADCPYTAAAGWLRGGRRSHQRLSNVDDDDDDDAGSGNGEGGRRNRGAAARGSLSDDEEEDALAARRAAADEVCLVPASLGEWLAQPLVKILMVSILSGLVCGIEAANAMFTKVPYWPRPPRRDLRQYDSPPRAVLCASKHSFLAPQTPGPTSPFLPLLPRTPHVPTPPRAFCPPRTSSRSTLG